MRKKSLKVMITALLMTLIIVTPALAGSAGGSVPTSEFGTFTWSLTTGTINAVAETGIQKYSTSTQVGVKLSVVNNITGEQIAYGQQYKQNSSYASKTITFQYPGDGIPKGAFSTHEAIGNSSIVRYEAQTL